MNDALIEVLGVIATWASCPSSNPEVMDQALSTIERLAHDAINRAKQTKENA